MNRTIISGRLVDDLERGVTAGGTVVAKGRIAIDEAGTKKGENDRYEPGFFNIESYGPGADAALKTVGKGWLVELDGRLAHDTWKDKETGASRQAVKVIGSIGFLAAPRERGAGREQQAESEAESDKGSDQATSPVARPTSPQPLAAAGAER